VAHYTKLNFRASWVSTDPLLMEDREHLPDNVDKNVICVLIPEVKFISMESAWKCTAFLRGFLFLQMIFFPCYNKKTLLVYSFSPFRLISSLSFNLALLFLISRRQFLLTQRTVCLCCQGMSHLAPFHYTFTVICQHPKCKTCMRHTKRTN
jgi:hypothetical protein